MLRLYQTVQRFANLFEKTDITPPNLNFFLQPSAYVLQLKVAISNGWFIICLKLLIFSFNNKAGNTLDYTQTTWSCR